MTNRPAIVGMNNPYGEREDLALFPRPKGSAGHRLCRMVQERTGCTERDYIRVFDRMNLLGQRTWNATAARRAAPAILERLEGRTVMVLGEAVRAALGLPRSPVMTWRPHSVMRRWCTVPHPSGLNRWYNDPVNRVAVVLMMEEMYLRATGET